MPQTYRDRSYRGDAASRFAAFLANVAGHDAEVLPKRQCPPHLPSLRFAFVDDGDIVVSRRMVQTKWININWNDASDFPYDMMIIDEWHKAKRSQNQNAAAYWIFNKTLTRLTVFPMGHSRKLVQRELFNKDVDQRRAIAYAMAPLDLLVWSEIEPATRAAALEWGIVPAYLLSNDVA